jgi:integrase
VPATAERWREEAIAWVRQENEAGKYEGRNGQEAVRFLSRLGRQISELESGVTPMGFEARHVRLLYRQWGRRPSSIRYYGSLLSAFLTDPPRRNLAVRESGIMREVPHESPEQLAYTGAELEKISAKAVRLERVVVAIESIGRRRVELERALLSDLHLDSPHPYMDVRAKGGHGAVTGQAALNRGVLKELDWWLPLRQSWSEHCASDDGHLFVRRDRRPDGSTALVRVSRAFFDRSVRAAAERAGLRGQNHAFRRTCAQLLEQRGATTREIQGVLLHKHLATTEIYLERLAKPARLARVVALLDAGRNE